MTLIGAKSSQNVPSITVEWLHIEFLIYFDEITGQSMLHCDSGNMVVAFETTFLSATVPKL